MFVKFINDFLIGLNNVTKLFSDDLKEIRDASNVNRINEDLASLEIWQELWLLRFNASKCKVMHLNFNENCSHSYTFDGTSLEAVNKDKY